jgi:hypothetical protein
LPRVIEHGKHPLSPGNFREFWRHAIWLLVNEGYLTAMQVQGAWFATLCDTLPRNMPFKPP